MANVSKGTVQFVNPVQKKDGTTAYQIIVDGVSYYDSKGNFKDKMGQQIDFEWSPSNDGNLKFINPVGGFKRGGRSPEEIALQKNSFALAYAKDITVAIIQASNNLITALPDGIKYLQYIEGLREASVTMTERTMEKFLAALDKKE